jgi:acetyltransferase-like isoleucine patch superfamily enzyme
LVLARHIPTNLGVGLRYALLKRLMVACGECVAVFEGVYLYEARKLRVGNNVSIHPMCYINAGGGITIGNDVSIAHATTIMSYSHDYARPDMLIRDAPVIPAPVVIGDNVWIAAGVRIMAGVTIGEHSVVGAGAVVTKDIPPHSIAVGVPARVVKTIEPSSLSPKAGVPMST